MAYNEYLQERIESVLNEKKVVYRAMKMMGRLCFIVDEKMCTGVMKGDLMARVGANVKELLRSREGARLMDFTKRPMKDYLFIDPDKVDYAEDLKFWEEQCLNFNTEAKASNKRKPKNKK